MGLDSYCENGEDYEIYSLYYDTKHHDLIRHSLSHPYYKEKLRVRSYRIPRSQQEPVFVELKKKIGGVTAKRRVELPLGEAYRLLAGGALPVMPDYLSREVLREISCFFKPVCGSSGGLYQLQKARVYREGRSNSACHL